MLKGKKYSSHHAVTPLTTQLPCLPCMLAHTAACEDIRSVLKRKDEEYVKLLKRQAADTDTLLGAMARQLADLAAAYREELENVERALLQVRGG